MVRDTMRIYDPAGGFVRITIPRCRRHILLTDLPMGQIVGESDIGREDPLADRYGVYAGDRLVW